METLLACMAMIVWFVFVASVSWAVCIVLCNVLDAMEAKCLRHIKDKQDKHARRMPHLQATVSRPGKQFHVVERENQNANVVE